MTFVNHVDCKYLRMWPAKMKILLFVLVFYSIHFSSVFMKGLFMERKLIIVRVYVWVS